MERFCPKCFASYSSDHDKCPVDGTSLVLASDRELVGELLDGKYRVLRCIGRGGMGVVYEAEQALVERKVALKVLRRDVVQDVSAVKRFMVEAKAIARLSCPHTITLHDFGVSADGLLYYTMPLLEGRPLSVVLREEAPLGAVRTTELMVQVCLSLEEAHEAGILHRDLKPENLFLSLVRRTEHVTVLDFGIAKLQSAQEVDPITRAGVVCGTPGYLSPEQLLGKQATPASDVYALGLILFEMLTGTRPFHDSTTMGLMLKHINDQAPSLREANPRTEIPRFFEDLVARTLMKDPSERFGSVGELRHTLMRGFVQETQRSVAEVDTAPDNEERSPSAKALPERSGDAKSTLAFDTTVHASVTPGADAQEFLADEESRPVGRGTTAAMVRRFRSGRHLGAAVIVVLAVLGFMIVRGYMGKTGPDLPQAAGGADGHAVPETGAVLPGDVVVHPEMLNEAVAVETDDAVRLETTVIADVHEQRAPSDDGGREVGQELLQGPADVVVDSSRTDATGLADTAHRRESSGGSAPGKATRSDRAVKHRPSDKVVREDKAGGTAGEATGTEDRQERRPDQAKPAGDKPVSVHVERLPDEPGDDGHGTPKVKVPRLEDE